MTTESYASDELNRYALVIPAYNEAPTIRDIATRALRFLPQVISSLSSTLEWYWMSAKSPQL